MAPRNRPLALLRALRPKQWMKNLLVFAGFVFTLNERWIPFSPAMWSFFWRSLGAFGLFSLVSSSVYLLNDVRDVEKDRLHPTSGGGRSRRAICPPGWRSRWRWC